MRWETGAYRSPATDQAPRADAPHDAQGALNISKTTPPGAKSLARVEGAAESPSAVPGSRMRSGRSAYMELRLSAGTPRNAVPGNGSPKLRYAALHPTGQSPRNPDKARRESNSNALPFGGALFNLRPHPEQAPTFRPISLTSLRQRFLP
jgi:hypothetical protein